jgi:LemA protein
MKSIVLILLSAALLTSCGYNAIPQAENDVEAKVAEVDNQYKRRVDLIPNLVEVVKGYAKHEKETLEGVIAARAKATSITLNANDLSPEKLKQYQEAQGQLSSALGKLMMVSERYPNLKANENFQALQAQLEGTENRITVARRDYIESVQRFNNLVTTFPSSLTNSIFYKKDKKAQFTAAETERATPKVQF